MCSGWTCTVAHFGTTIITTVLTTREPSRSPSLPNSLPYSNSALGQHGSSIFCMTCLPHRCLAILSPWPPPHTLPGSRPTPTHSYPCTTRTCAPRKPSLDWPWAGRRWRRGLVRRQCVGHVGHGVGQRGGQRGASGKRKRFSIKTTAVQQYSNECTRISATFSIFS